MSDDAATIADALSDQDWRDLRDIESGARTFYRHLRLFDDGLVQRQLRGVILDYASCPLEVTTLGRAVLERGLQNPTRTGADGQ